MSRHARRSKKAGLPPGTLMHIGEKLSERTHITILDYDAANFLEKETEAIEECFPFRAAPTITWINVDGIHDISVLQQLGECYGLHPLVLEDILNTDQRPKMEDFGDYVFIVLKMLSPDRHGGIVTEQVSLIVGENFLLSFRERQSDIFNPIRERIKFSKGFIRKSGVDYLAHALLDALVDRYFVVLEKLEAGIEVLEEEVISNATPRTLREIHRVKRDLIYLRKAIVPLREVIGALQRGESRFFGVPSRLYLRDVYDHTVHAIDTLETLRDLTTSLLDIYLSSINNRTNAVVKVLTVIATIFMPPTFIASLYGMNFKYMPELSWRWGYPAVLLLMAAIAVGMQVYFRRKKWL
jgi:magnesium transporter